MTGDGDRFSRVVGTRFVGPAGLNQLQASTAAVLGVGNIGGPLAQHLALLGVRLILVDRDRVNAPNLGTQGFAHTDLGVPKVVARKCALSALNPSCCIEPVYEDLRRLGMGALRSADVLFCCLDSRRLRTWVNEIAVRLETPWIDCALDGSGSELFGRVAAYEPCSSACYLCPHDAESLRAIQQEGSGACPQWSWTLDRTEESPPTLAVSALGAAVASVAAVWGLKILLGKSESVAGREVYLDLDRGRLESHKLRRNDRCLMEHRSYALTRVDGTNLGTSVAETFDRIEESLGGEAVLELQRRSVTTRLRCPACGSEKTPYRLLDALGPAEITCTCGAILEPLAVGLLDRFGRKEAVEFLEMRWERLGLPHDDVVVASSGGRELAFVIP